jgi:prevent-host-death family protein
MKRIPIEEARARLSSVVDGVGDEAVLLTRRGQAVAAIIPVEQYEIIRSAERRAQRRPPVTADPSVTMPPVDDSEVRSHQHVAAEVTAELASSTPS